jgi:hypothetical protein
VALPENVKYLFENKQLDILSFLCILNCTKKKNIELDEFLFYYALVVSYVDLKFENSTVIFGIKNAKYEVNALFLYIKDNMNLILLYLSNNDLITISSKPVDDYYKQIFIAITENGRDIVANIRNNYFLNLVDRAKYVIKNVKYSRSNKNKLFRGEYYDADGIE